jgi:DNA-binding PadR family transcriptional regulator
MPALTQTPATFHILLTLAEGPRHGYAIKRAVEERTGGIVRLGPGTLYAALSRLVEARLVRQMPPGTTQAPTSGPPSPGYALTREGRDALHRELDRLEQDVRAGRAVLRRNTGKGQAR